MELTAIKCELSSGRRRLSAANDNEVCVANKSVKRRRREPVVVAGEIGCNLDQKVHQQQLDQSSTSTTTTATATTTTTTTTATTTTVKRSSRFRGVSRHRWTGRFEAHLWDKGSWNVTQKKKGKQVYLGAYDEEECAARAYDLAALKYWGPTTFTNFPVSDYEKEIEVMQNVTKEEYLASLRRKSSGFSRGVSKYRGVARHHHNGRWEARIGRVFGNKYLYLGTYSTQEEAAHAYDIAAIEYRGINAVTNFDLSTYIRWLRPGANTLVTEPRTNRESQAVPKSSSFTQANSSISAIDDFAYPRKQDNYSRKTTVSSCNKSSSPTALSLLLRSSIFKELVEKNSSSTSDEIEEVKQHIQIGSIFKELVEKNSSSTSDEIKEVKQHIQMGNDAEYGRAFYDEIPRIPYVCSTSDTLPSIELQDENVGPSPLYNETGQSLWNDVLTMSSMH